MPSSSHRLADFDFELPPDQIAQTPLADRAGARMLVIHRSEGRWEDRAFRDLPGYLHSGDCLVLNDSRVIPARLHGHRAGRTGHAEVLLIRPETGDASIWSALVRPGRKLPVGERIVFGPAFEAEVIDRAEHGERRLRLYADDVWAAIETHGHVPLPPYIRREDSDADRERYQTVFAKNRGSVAAPTAGLHFTPEILAACRQAGADVAHVTLHVGLGTFQPIEAEDLADVKLHAERFVVSSATEEALAKAKRVIPIGTTALRTLESWALGKRGETDLFISPGFTFQKTGALLTNFHLPQSSLFVLVCALAGTDLMKAAYGHAVASGYRFYSYGDCMLIL